MKNNHRYLILFEIAILIFIVLRLINIGGEPVFSSNSGSYVVPGTMTREFSFFDYISFLEFRADEYFADYALVVRISFMIVLLSTIVLLGIVGRISYEGYVYRQQARRLNHFVKKYHDNFWIGIMYDDYYTYDLYDIDSAKSILEKNQKGR